MATVQSKKFTAGKSTFHNGFHKMMMIIEGTSSALRKKNSFPWLELNLGPLHYEVDVYPIGPFRHIVEAV